MLLCKRSIHVRQEWYDFAGTTRSGLVFTIYLAVVGVDVATLVRVPEYLVSREVIFFFSCSVILSLLGRILCAHQIIK